MNSLFLHNEINHIMGQQDCKNKKYECKRIGIVALYDPHINKNECSGTLYQATKALQRAGFETVWVKRKIPFMFRVYNKLIKVVNKLFSCTICDDRTYIGSWLNAHAVEIDKHDDLDYLFVIHHFFVPLWNKTKIPVIYHSDVTFELVNNYYLHEIRGFGKLRAEQIERVALAKVAFHLSPSYWRNNSVVGTYGVDSSKTIVLPYGPCIDTDKMIKPRNISKGKAVKLLFSGVDWDRKGGDIAVLTTLELNKRGLECILVIVGMKKLPEQYQDISCVKLLGFLNKNNEEDYNKYMNVFRECDIFFLPTKAEGAGIVFSEASAFGLPILTHDTGGVGTYVQNGINGYRLPLGSDISAYADKVMEMMEPEAYNCLSKGALKLANDFLNWSLWTEAFKRIL